METIATRILRLAAPRISREIFHGQRCLHSTRLSPLSQLLSPSPRRPPTTSNFILQAQCRRRDRATVAASDTETPLESLGRALHRETPTPSAISSSNHFASPNATTFKSSSKSKSLPDVSSNSVAYWLLGSAASVFGIVVFGGLTRLTESGLSITEWKPVTGSLPPLSYDDWMSEFDKYRASPEFKLLNPSMQLEDFKQIYYMEWGHRLWGRVVGLSFVLPAVYFVARGKVSKGMRIRLLGIACLIGTQGIIGWWMVKSGLKDDLFAPGSHPRVSQYRLTAHLGTAFIAYTAMLYNGLPILRDNAFLRNPNVANTTIATLQSAPLARFRRLTAALAVLVFITAMSGGLVAGLDAGMIYNEFPYMGNGLTPPKSELFSAFYSRRPDGSDIWWRNMLENPSTVQLDHRILATTTFTSIMAFWAYTRFGRVKSTRVYALLPKHVRTAVTAVVGLVWMQVTLGISTLIYLVPTPVAAAHQAGSLALLSGILVLGSRVWIPARSVALVKRAAQAASSPASSSSSSLIAGRAVRAGTMNHAAISPLKVSI